MSDDASEDGAPLQSAFFRATEASRYARQAEIRSYESSTGRNLVVFWGPILSAVVTPFADAINDVELGQPLDLMLTSLGGDAEAAIRIATMCHAGRDDFRVIVPDTAASAATLLALAAEAVVMSDTSALGPVDPQILLSDRNQYFPAKGIVELVDDLDGKTRDNPHAFELYAALLADVDAIAYQTAKDAIRRTDELVPEVLRLRREPLPADKIDAMTHSLQSAAMHSATIGHTKAQELGIPAEYLSPHSTVWDHLWRLHAHYAFLLGPQPRKNLIEGRRVSFRFD